MASGPLGVYQRVVITGTGPGSEVWQTGFYLSANTPPANQTDLQAMLTAIGPSIDTWWTAVKAHCYAMYSYTGANMYQYIDPSTTAQFQANRAVTPVPGTLVTNGCPIDTALVVSLRSPIPGRSGRGRMYVPFHDAITFNTGLWSGTQTGTVGTATKALFTGVTGAGAWVPIVASRTTHRWNSISNIVTDNKPDVQRRRENKLLPSATQILPFP